MLINLHKSKQLRLKPYSFDLSESYYLVSNHSFQELLDLKDLRNAAVKELTLKNEIELTKKSIIDIEELLSNPNIKKIKLIFTASKTNRFLNFISNLLRKNTTIQEIEITLFDFKLQIENLTSSQRQVWSFFINTINSRLVKIDKTPFSTIDTDINKLIFSNSNLKEFLCHDELNTENSNVLEYILTSGKYFNKLEIFTSTNNTNQRLFDKISKLETKAVINTLVLNANILSERFFDIIDNAYLYKIETIQISDTTIICPQQIFDHILKLSNNSLNTVKRLVMKRNCQDIDIALIITNLLNSNKYNIEKMPRMFIDDYREVIINHNVIDDTYNATCLCENNHCIYYEKYDFSLDFRGNSLDEESYTKLLVLLSNNPELLYSFTVGWVENSIQPESNNPIDVLNRVKNVNRMKELYIKFKEKNVYSNRSPKITKLTFNFTEDRELDVFYFTILEIMIDMKIKINRFKLVNCSLIKLADFMNKNKESKTLYINNIDILINKLDKENIDKLYQYSDLIEGKISIDFNIEVDLNNLSVKKELVGILNSSNKENNNFVNFDNIRNSLSNFNFKSMKELKEKVDCARSITRTLETKDNFLLKNIRCLDFRFYDIDLEIIYSLFSFLKEYKYFLNDCCLYDFEFLIAAHAFKINSLILENVIDNKHRETDIYYCASIIRNFGKYIRKNKRYMLLHGIMHD